MASEFIHSKGIAIYNASFYESTLEECLLAGTWAVDNFLSSMACANEKTQKRMIWGTLLHLRKVAFSDDYTTCFLGASYWAVDNFLSSMACANEKTQKRMIWGTLLHLRKVAFSDDYTTCFLGASYNHIFSHPLIRSHLNYMF